MTKIKHDHRLNLILQARNHDPFDYLGMHSINGTSVFRTFLPHATQVWLETADGWKPLNQIHHEGMYEWRGTTAVQSPCKLRIEENSHLIERHDPYSFGSSITADELYLYGEGRLSHAYKTLGAHPMTQQGVEGVRFVVWAPNAERVSVIGNFNRWDGRTHPMRVLGSSGVWEIFIPALKAGELYKFEIRNRHSGHNLIKTDPYGFGFEPRPGSAAKVMPESSYVWQDQEWMSARPHHDWLHSPFNCYELHLGGWKRDSNGYFLNYRETAKKLVQYVQEMGYTHIELMPISEHPLNESWGYQTTGYYGVTNRYGNADDFRYFVDLCHQANIGVILDWVPSHFPKDDWALARFDGTALYEHEDPRLGEHQDWGTYIFNYGRNEVRNFLLANAHFWLGEFHIDGLRVDAVASMLYLDYSRKEGEWLPNQYGGRENLDAIHFLQALNIMVHNDFPGTLTIAEESTAWPMVSRPVYLGGIGFSMKWNMGWMNDTLRYIQQDPIHRRYHHHELTFGQLYAYSENFLLPFSHDEVVHGKQSMIEKMPGDKWQKFANLRLLYTYQTTMPGKKLNFMGNEIAQSHEWNVNASLQWELLESAENSGLQKASADLNHLYKNIAALHDLDFDSHGFSWIDCYDSDQSVIIYQRKARDGSFVVIALNFTPVVRENYRIGVPAAGEYREIFNSDAACYGGSNCGNGNGLHSESKPWMQHPYSVIATLPPLAGFILQLK